VHRLGQVVLVVCRISCARAVVGNRILAASEARLHVVERAPSDVNRGDDDDNVVEMTQA